MLRWNSEFETGIAVIDEDHRRLVETMNQLERALNAGTGSQQIGPVLDFLAAYAAEHFQREEGCMAQFRCPNALANKAAHQVFIDKLRDTRDRFDASSSSGALLALHLHRDLCDWIVSHILRVDSSLKLCNRRSPRPNGPENKSHAGTRSGLSRPPLS